MIKKVGKIALPRGSALLLKKLLKSRLGAYNEVIQGRADFEKKEVIDLKTSIETRLLEYLKEEIPRSQSSFDFLRFKKVTRHKDDWRSIIRYKNSWVSTAFFHTCISGSCTIKTASHLLSIKRGDMFVLNPNVYHEVISDTDCITLCFDTALPFARSLPSVN